MNDEPVLINLNSIRSVERAYVFPDDPTDCTTAIEIIGRDSIEADEPYETVLKLIRRAGGDRLTVRASDLEGEQDEHGNS